MVQQCSSMHESLRCRVLRLNTGSVGGVVHVAPRLIHSLDAEILSFGQEARGQTLRSTQSDRLDRLWT